MAVINAWAEVIDLFHQALETARQSHPAVCRDVEVIAFSDTIIATWQGDRIADLLLLAGAAMAAPMFEALPRGIYLRGVVAVGSFYRSPQLIIGPAIDEAAEWHTHHDWIGIAATPTARLVIDRLVHRGQGLEAERIWPKYAVPTKTGVHVTRALAWPRIAALIDPDPKSLILDAFASRPIGIGEAGKYDNTLAFIDFCYSP